MKHALLTAFICTSSLFAGTYKYECTGTVSNIANGVVSKSVTYLAEFQGSGCDPGFEMGIYNSYLCLNVEEDSFAVHVGNGSTLYSGAEGSLKSDKVSVTLEGAETETLAKTYCVKKP